MIGNEDCFSIWAPPGVLWSDWAKPAIFASASNLSTDKPLAVTDIAAPGVPEGRNDATVIVDLPGSQAVSVGLAMAKRGFRPVPLFNGTNGPSPIVLVQELLDALGGGSQLLKGIRIEPDARPAFLLDSNRTWTVGSDLAGYYDNRWVVLPQDLPSATLLRSQGIREVTLILSGTLDPARDLAHVLLRWREGGLRLRSVDLAEGRSREDLTVREPSLFRHAWYVAVALMGLRRSNVGGFGSTVPQRTSGGFYG